MILRGQVSVELTDKVGENSQSQLYELSTFTEASTNLPFTAQEPLITYRDQTLFTLRIKGEWLSFWSSRFAIEEVQKVEHGELFMIVLGKREEWVASEEKLQAEPLSFWKKLPDTTEVGYFPLDTGLVQIVVPITQRAVFLQTISSARSLYSQKARLFFRNEAGDPNASPRELAACLSSGSTKRSMARLLTSVALPIMAQYAQQRVLPLTDAGTPVRATNNSDPSRLSAVQGLMRSLSASGIAAGAITDVLTGLESMLTKMRSCGPHAEENETSRNARGLFRRKVPLSSDPAHFVLKLPGMQSLRLQRDKKDWVLFNNDGSTELSRWPTLVHWKAGQTYDLGPVSVQVVALRRKSLPFPTGKHSSKRLLMPVPGSDEYRLVAKTAMTEAELLLWGFIVYTIRVSESIPLGWLTVIWLLIGGAKAAHYMSEIKKAT
jgi:hypothetical protein